MTVNFETDNLIIACYKHNLGGKFLLNTLGLSDHVVLQCSDLATQQLDGRLSPADKFNLLITRLNDTQGQWNDLGLGCGALFIDYDYDGKFLDLPPEENFEFHPVITTLSHSDRMFGIVAHNYPRLLRTLTVWPKAKVLCIVNGENFLVRYRPRFSEYIHLKNYWDRVRGPSWPMTPPKTLSELAQLDAGIQDELSTMFGNEIMRFLDNKYQKKVQAREREIRQTLQSTNLVVEWDCDWFLDRDLFLHNAKILYDRFGLDDFNETFILGYYDNWTSTLSRLNGNK